MILASISGGQSLGKPLPDLSRQGQSLCEGPFSVSCRKSKPFKPSDAVGFDEKSRHFYCVKTGHLYCRAHFLAFSLIKSCWSGTL